MSNVSGLPINENEIMERSYESFIACFNNINDIVQNIIMELPENFELDANKEVCRNYKDSLVEKCYNIAIKLTDRELGLTKEDFENEIIQPAMNHLSWVINKYASTVNDKIIIYYALHKDFEVYYDYTTNVGLRCKYKNNTLIYEIICGKLI